MSKKRRNLPAPDQPQAPLPLLTKEDLKQAIIESYEEIEHIKAKQDVTKEATNVFRDFVKYIFVFLSIVAGTSTGLCIIESIKVFINHTAYSNIASLISAEMVLLGAIIITGLLCAFFIFMGKSLKEEKDKNYLASLLSSVLAFVAITITLLSTK